MWASRGIPAVYEWSASLSFMHYAYLKQTSSWYILQWFCHLTASLVIRTLDSYRFISCCACYKCIWLELFLLWSLSHQRYCQAVALHSHPHGYIILQSWWMHSLEIYGKWKIQASKQASNMQPTYTQCCHASLGLPQACMPQLMLALSI